ncbi:MAG: NAD-dependent epimerase/dehydratase family protein [Clostridiales bacterium]|nr:NAD-dependent epimerase/dehydratase family protein [Clostridiales bacterium]
MKLPIESPNDAILQEDLELLAQSLPAEDLQGSTILITGATGLLGAQTVKALLCLNRTRGTGIQVLAWVRSQAKAQKVFGSLLELDELQLVVGDITDRPELPKAVDYIIHTASATSSRYFVTHPVETIATALDGTRNLLELAREKQVKGFLYLSSLEVYGTPDGSKAAISEEDYGYIDPLSVRSSYSEGKRLVECLCASYAGEYQVPVKIARLSQTFGAGVEYNDGRVFAEFARCAIEGKDIVLHTQGRTVRSYCYTRDAISAFFTVLLYGEQGRAYNVTNRDTVCSIREMAELVCSLYPQQGICVRVDIPEDVAALGYNPEMVIRLDSSRLEALGWRPTVGLAEMFRRLIASMQDKSLL